MRLSSNLRRYRWAVFVAWLLLLVPVGLSGDEPVRQPHRRRFRGRGFAVAARAARARGALPRPGRLPAGAGRGPARRRLLRRHERRRRPARAASRPRCRASRWCPTRSSRRPSPTGPTSSRCRLDFNNTGAVDVAKQLRKKVGINGDQPGRGRRTARSSSTSSARARSAPPRQRGHQTRHRPGREVEPSDRPDRPARGVRFAGRRGHAAGAGHLHGRGDDGPGLSAVDGTPRCRCS